MKYTPASAALLQVFCLLGCSAVQTLSQKQAAVANFGSSDAVPSSVASTDLSPRFPRAVDNGNSNAQDSPAPMLFPGIEPQTPPPASPTPPDPQSQERIASAEPVALRGDGVEMNFDGTDIASAAKMLLGDVLHLNFEIDPRVQGSVTLASVGPIPRNEVLPVFEGVLRMQNAALVHEGNFVKIVPVTEAAAHTSISTGAGQPGFGISVVPLRFVSAATVAKTAENLL